MSRACVCGALAAEHTGQALVCVRTHCGGFSRLQHATAPALPANAAQRKAMPIASGVLAYFPRALAAVAHCSKVGNDQHNPGEPLHWAREKSKDEPDALVRHLIDHLASGETLAIDTDGVPHLAKVAWRALAFLEKALEAQQSAAPPASAPPQEVR